MNNQEDIDIYSEDGAAKYRENFIKNNLKKAAEALFKNMPECNYVIATFAQYWNDEAEDAVHYKLVPSETMMSWTDLLKPSCNTLLNKYDIGISSEYISNYGDAFKLAKDFLDYLDNDEDFIYAFSSFCKEGCSQEDNHVDAYSPHIIFIREKDNVAIKNWKDIAILT